MGDFAPPRGPLRRRRGGHSAAEMLGETGTTPPSRSRGGRRRRRGDGAEAPGETRANEREGVVTLQFCTDPWVPFVPRGAFFKTAPPSSSLCCWAYSSPFLHGEFRGWRVTKLEPDTLFGPVHDTHRNWVFLAVRVPVWQKYILPSGELIWKVLLLWVNVYNAQTKTHYAKRIASGTVRRWRADGWQDRFLDENED